MTKKKCLEAVAAARTALPKAVAVRNAEAEDRVPHLHWMLNEIEKFVRDGRRDKANRWLGFVQGALWVLKFRTVAEMKKDNAPDGTDAGDYVEEVKKDNTPDPDDTCHIAPLGTRWVCAACGKTAVDRYEFSGGWDESCMMHAVLCYLSDSGWKAVKR